MHTRSFEKEEYAGFRAKRSPSVVQRGNGKKPNMALELGG
jgi:hypothetical protein